MYKWVSALKILGNWGGGGGGGLRWTAILSKGEWQYSQSLHAGLPCNGLASHPVGSSTVEPRFNKVPRGWGNWFVISRVRYIENLDIMNL